MAEQGASLPPTDRSARAPHPCCVLTLDLVRQETNDWICEACKAKSARASAFVDEAIRKRQSGDDEVSMLASEVVSCGMRLPGQPAPCDSDRPSDAALTGQPAASPVLAAASHALLFTQST